MYAFICIQTFIFTFSWFNLQNLSGTWINFKVSLMTQVGKTFRFPFTQLSKKGEAS